MVPVYSLSRQIIKNLTPDLLKPKYRGSSNIFYGHCYVASEALYHLYGKRYGYKPYVMRVNNDTHWFLKKNDHIIDLTKKQFNFDLDYTTARRCSFLTVSPSKRCRILISRLHVHHLEI
jgi:hypothetical protein